VTTLPCDFQAFFRCGNETEATEGRVFHASNRRVGNRAGGEKRSSSQQLAADLTQWHLHC
jgi:hypothetical protein